VHVTCVHPGGVRTNIVRNGRHNHDAFGQPTETAALSREFDRMARTTPESAALTIWSGVLSNAPRVLVGADAHVMDLLQRLFPTGYPVLFNAAMRWFQKQGQKQQGQRARA
jgi:hypothetical protein